MNCAPHNTEWESCGWVVRSDRPSRKGFQLLGRIDDGTLLGVGGGRVAPRPPNLWQSGTPLQQCSFQPVFGPRHSLILFDGGFWQRFHAPNSPAGHGSSRQAESPSYGCILGANAAWLLISSLLIVLGTLLTSGEVKAQGVSEASETEVESFREWIRGGASDEARGLVLAKRRALAMRRLMRDQPERALSLALDSDSRRKLPSAWQRFFEEEVSGYGTIGALFDCEHSVRARAVRINGRLYLSHAAEREDGDSPVGRRIPLRGIVLDGEIALAKNPLRSAGTNELREGGERWHAGDVCVGCRKSVAGLVRTSGACFANKLLPLCREEHLQLVSFSGAIAGSEGGSAGTSPSPAREWTHGAKRLLYIPTQYSNQSSPPTSRSTAEAALAQVSLYIANQSYQQTTVTADVSDPVQVAQTASHYESVGLGQLYNDAVALARTLGWDADDYDFVFIRHAGGPGGAGVGLVGEKGAWVQTDSWSVLAHELGHNYGLSHANGWRPKTSVPFGPGETVEYADEFDMMGPNRGSFSTYEKTVLHWMPDSSLLRVTNSGLFRIHGFDVGPLGSNQLYSVSLRKDVRDYWLDYRGEFQSGNLAPFALNGLQLRWPQWSQSRGGSTLVDTTPGTPRQFEDAPLLVGRTFSDAEAGIHVTPVTRSPTPGQWLDVFVHFSGNVTNARPEALMAVSATNVVVGATVTISVSANDPDGDLLAFGWETAVAGSSAVLAVSSNTPSITYSWSTAGRHEVRCVVSDMKGGVTVVSTIVEVGTVADHSISGRVAATDGSPRSNIRVFSLLPTVSVGTMSYVTHASYRSALTDDEGRYVLLNVPAGTHTVRVMPTLADTFAPTTGNGTMTVGSDISGIDFLSLPKPAVTVRGIVRDGGQVISNAVVEIAGRTGLSAADGTFSVSNVPPGTYDPKLSGSADFIAPNAPVYVDGASVTNADLFRVLYPVTGKVPGNIGLVYVSNGEPGRSVIALPDFSGGFFGDWVYELRLPRGIWNLEAACSGFTMLPSGFTNPVVVAGAESVYYSYQGVQPVVRSNLNFSATAGTTYVIRGRVTDGSSPLPGVTISSGSYVATTDSNGNYALGGLSPGGYNLGAMFAGYNFVGVGFNNPVSVGPDATNINFVAISTTTNPPAITGQPQSQLVTVTSNVTFTIGATGTPPLSYQWFFNGSNAISGATKSTFTITNVQDVHAGSYAVRVSNGTSVTSSNAVLAVNHPPVAPVPVLERFAFNGTKARVVDFLGIDPDGDTVALLSVGPASAQGGTVVTNSGWVVYTPPAGFTNSDSFPFVLSDGRGGVSQGTATVTVTFDNVIPQNLRAELLGDGSVRLTFDGIPGRTYSVEFTDDLENPNWQILGTAIAGEAGVFSITDFLPPGAPQRFYRATWP